MQDLIDESIEALQLAAKMSEQYYHKPLMIAYSGGKDSDVLLDLALRANINMEVIHSHTTADAPQTVYHRREVFKRLQEKGIKTEVIYPVFKGKRISMWELIPLKLMPPTRLVRYCCDVLKETAGKKRLVACGVRADESSKRAQYNIFTIYDRKKDKRIYHDITHVKEVYQEAQEYPEVYDCKYITSLKKNKKGLVNPVLNWTETDVWTYIHTYNIQVCDLYSMGYKRVGCIGCPMASKGRYKEFSDFPQFEKNYKKAFERMLNYRISKGLKNNWNNADEVFDWWMEKKPENGQMTFNLKEDI